MEIPEITIAGRKIGLEHPPFVIAEMSGNHNQSLERALAIVECAADAGAHAVKLQTYTAETMTLDLSEGEFMVPGNQQLWGGEKLYDLYQKAHTPWDWHKPIIERAQELGLIVFSTPFDETAVDFLESLSIPAYKIASFEITDLHLIKKVANTGKPVIISTGMATAAEIEEAVRAAREAGCSEVVLLKCTSTYPASPESSNLLTIPHMREMFKTQVGISDHTMGVGVPLAAVAVGATVIEKHLTLSRAEGGIDSAFSLEPQELAALVTESKRAWEAMGEVAYGPTKEETKSLVFRRSLYIVEDLKSGDRLTTTNVRCIRPGLGLAPKFMEVVLGKRVNQAVKKGTPLSWDLIS